MDDIPEVKEAPKSNAKRRVNHTFKWLLTYNILLFVLAAIFSVLKLPLGGESLLATLAGTAIIYLLTRRKYPVNPFEKGGRKMTGKDFLLFFCMIAIGQMLTVGIMTLLDAMGLQGTSIDISFNTVPMFIYAAFTGPFCEEMVYRGFACGNLRKNGKIFAVAMSALAFGLMHANAWQFAAGLLTGLVLGFVFIEYSIWWTVLLHVINNFVLSALPELIFKNESLEKVEIAEYIVLGAFAVLGIVTIIRRRDEIASYLKDPANRSEKGTVKEALKSCWFWLFVIVYTAAVVLMMLFPNAFSAAAGSATGAAEAAVKALPLF